MIAVSGAAAQTEIVQKSEAQRLGCLVQPDRPLTLPERTKLDRAYRSIRLLLKFNRPDAKPTFEVLFNSAREDMQDLAFDRVASYRLPCLRPQDGEVNALQEFSFRNHDQHPQAGHLVADITFGGDAEAPPEVNFSYAKASGALQRAVRNWVSNDRMPCRTAGEKPRVVRQRFSMFPDNKRRHGFSRERFPLREFLGMTQDPKALRAYFDLKTGDAATG